MVRVSHLKYLGVALESHLRQSVRVRAVVRELQDLSFRVSDLIRFRSD